MILVSHSGFDLFSWAVPPRHGGRRPQHATQGPGQQPTRAEGRRDDGNGREGGV